MPDADMPTGVPVFGVAVATHAGRRRDDRGDEGDYTRADARSAPGADLMAARVLRGAVVAGGGQVAALALRLASNLALTRLLEPDAFGLMAIVLAVTTGLQLISDVGIWQAIVRSPRGEDRAFLDTAWTLNVVRGLALFVVGCAAAVPASVFYGRAELAWLLPLCALQAPIQGLESTRAARATRAMRVGGVIALELASQLAGFVVALAVGTATRSVVALVAASLVAVMTRVVLGHALLPGPRDRLRWEPAALGEIFTFGRWVFVSTLLFFIGSRWDVFALGRLEGMGLLGVYGLAQLVTQVPVQVGERVAGFVLMPALAERFREAPQRFADDVRRARMLLFPAAALLFLGAAMTAPAFFMLYRSAWEDARWMSQLLVLVSWGAFVQDTTARALVALGDTRSLAVANAARLVATVAATAVGFEAGGVVGFMLGCAVGSCVGALVVGKALALRGVPVLGLDASATAMFAAALAVVCGLPRAVAAASGAPWELVTLALAPPCLGPLLARVVRTAWALRRAP